ncbi:MAG: hypothetical protein JWO05_1142 [Gemmatimonadetes bacterium]|nr:hypothetical protein [Gemmatimonadota bacterium]
MNRRAAILDLVGALLLILATVWFVWDIRKDGQVDRSTVIGVAIVAGFAAFLIDVVRSYVTRLIGIGCIVGAIAWAVRGITGASDGHVDISTAVGVLALVIFGCGLIDRQWTADQIRWVAGQIREILQPPSGPSGPSIGGAAA